MADLPSGTVTFLFTDIEGSTPLWEREPNQTRLALAHHDAIVRTTIANNGGYAFKKIGDAFQAAFAFPAQALAAALAAQHAFAQQPWETSVPIRVRMGLHVGPAVAEDNEYRTSHTLNRVARIMSCGHGGQILLSAEVADLVRRDLPADVSLCDMGKHRMKGLTHLEHLFQLVAPDLPSAFPPLKTLDHHPNNLPLQPTALIGREQEVASACALLGRPDVRLLTLTGPGGTGKTRLALQIATELLDDFEDGVYFVALAPISDSSLVISAIAATLGVKETGDQPLLETLKTALHDKHRLLLLDNFEQVVGAAPFVAELLAAAPHVKVLVTSRAALHLSGEREVAVPPLALPDRTQLPSLEQLTQYEAVRLFIERAQAVQATFVVTNANAPVIAQICHQLDGLPLAIILAAARIKLFPPQALLARLGNRLKLLTGGPRDLPARQQTIRDAIAWSYDLLDPGTRTLFCRLAVFVGGCTLEAVEAVCNTEGDLGSDVLEGLAALLDHSLLRQEEGPDGRPRFTMLETIREYALEQLTACAEDMSLRRCHAIYYGSVMRVLGQDEEYLIDDPTANILLNMEFDNLLAALRWAIEQRDVETALWISGVGLAFRPAAPLSERRAWIEAALALDDATRATRDTTVARAAARHNAGWTALDLGAYDGAQMHFLAYLALCQELNDQPQIAKAYRVLGWVALTRGALSEARTWIEQSLTLCQAVQHVKGIAWSLADLGHLTFRQGDLAQAEKLLTESLAHFENQGQVHGIVHACLSLGHVARAQGQLVQATTCYQASIGQQQSPSFVISSYVATAMEGLAGVIGTQGHGTRAAQLFGAAACLRENVGIMIAPVDRPTYERDMAAVRSQLGEDSFTAAWAEGHALTIEQAIAAALQYAPATERPRRAPGPAAPRPSALAYAAGLTAREVEVLRLVAEGLTDAQVAERLVLSTRTVNKHLQSIYGKLGLTSRSAATRFAVDHSLT